MYDPKMSILKSINSFLGRCASDTLSFRDLAERGRISESRNLDAIPANQPPFKSRDLEGLMHVTTMGDARARYARSSPVIKASGNNRRFAKIPTRSGCQGTDFPRAFVQDGRTADAKGKAERGLPARGVLGNTFRKRARWTLGYFQMVYCWRPLLPDLVLPVLRSHLPSPPLLNEILWLRK